jgi:hypothetical protein
MAFRTFNEKQAENWTDLFTFYNDKFTERETQWIFRGLPDANYKLETTLERVRTRFDKSLTDASVMEKKMIRQFKRQGHLYLENPPKDDDTIEWLALMQHFGAPTRLLDWTYSFFVALFFAVEKSEKRCAVWAINVDWVIKTAKSVREDDFKILRHKDPYLKSGYFFDLVFDKQPPRLVLWSTRSIPHG